MEQNPTTPMQPPAERPGNAETAAPVDPWTMPLAPVVSSEPVERRSTRKRRKRWSWKRWVANLMILAGVLAIPGYYLGTCGYTALQQHQLRQQLERENPQLAVAATVSEADFVPMEIRAQNVVDASSTAADIAAAEAAAAAAEAERLRQLEAFKAAADVFEASVGGQIGTPLGRIVIPSIGVDVIIVEGTRKGDLKEGPGHWEETPFPGQGGNFVVSGHRTTYGAPFFKLDDLEVGDEIEVILPYAVARYTVTRVIIVYPDEVETVAQLGREQISLAACHPIYSAKQRIVAQGDLDSFMLIEPQG